MDSDLHTPEPTATDGSIGAGVRDLTHQLSELVRHEVELAKSEFKHHLRRTRTAAAWAVSAAAAGTVAIGWVTAAGTLVLGHLVPPWGAAAISGTLLGAAAAVCGGIAYRTMKEQQPPFARSSRTMKDNLDWMKEKAS